MRLILLSFFGAITIPPPPPPLSFDWNINLYLSLFAALFFSLSTFFVK